MAKKAKESAPEEAEVPVEESVWEERAVVPVKEPEPFPEPEPIAVPSKAGPTIGQRIGRFFDFLARLLFVVVVLTALSIGLYYLLPRLYQQYVVPVQENTDQLAQLRDQQAENEQAIADLQTRLAEIESAQADQSEAFAALEARLGDLETEIAAHTETLAVLEQMQATLQTQADAASLELAQQVRLLKVMELLSRARLFMYQSNFGLARQDVQTARDLLAIVQPGAPEDLSVELAAVMLRLELTLSNLPNFPVAASDDLDIAWQILLAGLPQEAPTSLPTVTPDVTVTPEPDTTVTPAAEVTVTVTPTP